MTNARQKIPEWRKNYFPPQSGITGGGISQCHWCNPVVEKNVHDGGYYPSTLTLTNLAINRL